MVIILYLPLPCNFLTVTNDKRNPMFAIHPLLIPCFGYIALQVAGFYYDSIIN